MASTNDFPVLPRVIAQHLATPIHLMAIAARVGIITRATLNLTAKIEH